MIHSTAIVDSTAIVSDDCEIGPYCLIGADVEIGSGCKIRSHVVINGPTRIGKNTTFYSFSSIGEAPQDLKYNGEPTTLLIGDNNTIREYVTLHRGTVDGGGVTKIGNDNLLMAYTHVAHDCIVGNKVIMSNAASIAGHVVVEDNVILGGFTCVHQFARVGAHAFTGMATAANRDIPPYVIASGNLARAVGINKEGLRRRGFSPETIAALHKAFRTLLKSSKSRDEAVKELSSLASDYAEVQQLVDFITSSERGVVR